MCTIRIFVKYEYELEKEDELICTRSIIFPSYIACTHFWALLLHDSSAAIIVSIRTPDICDISSVELDQARTSHPQ